MPTSLPSDTSSVEAKLDTIAEYLHHMDRRDRMRMIGSFFRSLITLIPTVIFIWSIWYFAQHSEEIMKKMADLSAASAAKYTKENSQGLIDQMMQQYQTR